MMMLIYLVFEYSFIPSSKLHPSLCMPTFSSYHIISYIKCWCLVDRPTLVKISLCWYLTMFVRYDATTDAMPLIIKCMLSMNINIENKETFGSGWMSDRRSAQYAQSISRQPRAVCPSLLSFIIFTSFLFVNTNMIIDDCRRRSYKARFEHTFNKLYLWYGAYAITFESHRSNKPSWGHRNLTDYERVTYLDADNIAVHNMDELFMVSTLNCQHLSHMFHP
jgi:hypothetical protein